MIGSRATSALSVTLVLIVVGLCATLGVAVHRATSATGDDTTILLTVRPGTNPLRVSELKRTFNSSPWFTDYVFTDASTVLSREAETLDSVTRLGLQLLTENPFGDEFTLRLAPEWRNADSIVVLTERLRTLPYVDIVSGDAYAMGRANDGLQNVMIYLGILALVLLLISTALINNTISLSIYSRRFNIHTMKLVGATDSFIRRPFARAGAWTGFVAGLLAAAAVCGVQCWLMLNDNMVGPWITPATIVITGVSLVGAGTLIARGAAWWAANTYLHKSYDKLFKK